MKKMVSKTDFKSMLKDFDFFDISREELIKKSRDVIRLSKQLINALHRDEDASKLYDEIKKAQLVLDNLVSKNNKLYYQGSYKAAVMEYVEALLYYGFITEGKVLTRNDLNVNTDYYLLGVLDLTGELMRKAVLSASKGKYAYVVTIRDTMDSLYSELSNFDFRDNELRRKFDSIKYDLKKIEDLILELKLKGKI
tara:strand:- start:134 stop:718 length:585 start_codon:yes stop_codon:yes gene_type:complete